MGMVFGLNNKIVKAATSRGKECGCGVGMSLGYGSGNGNGRKKEMIERSKGEAAASNLGVWRMLLAVCSSGGETF